MGVYRPNKHESMQERQRTAVNGSGPSVLGPGRRSGQQNMAPDCLGLNADPIVTGCALEKASFINSIGDGIVWVQRVWVK